MGGARGPVRLRSEGPRVMGAPLCAKCSNVCCSLESLVVQIVGVCFSCHLIDPLLLGESASPFIDEGDDLTRERERVRMLLSLVAHAVRYKMMVGVHNTVVVRCMWKVLPYSSCMVNDGAHNTVDVHRHVGGALPRLSGIGVDDAHNTVG